MNTISNTRHIHRTPRLRVLPGYAQRTINPLVGIITVLATLCALQFSDRQDALRISGWWAWLAWLILATAALFLAAFLYANRDNLD